MKKPYWFRRDLRLSDHPALKAVAEAGEVALEAFKQVKNENSHSR